VQRFLKLSKPKGVVWLPAPDVKKKLLNISIVLQLTWVKTSRIFCVRSAGTSTRAIARIWGLGRVWQLALSQKPAYIIEVISERFDRLGEDEKDKVLLHEISHIPKNFSGALLPHIRRGKRSFHNKLEILVAQYLRMRK
jgi:predicted metallopeptidase